jgi:hypothetical protein
MTIYISNSWQDDSDWAVSAKGNYWRVLCGVHLVVGKSKGYESYWARVGEEFLDDYFLSLEAAQRAAEAEVS